MFCIGGRPGWTCCCRVVPGSTGEEQLEGDGVEVGPPWVRPASGYVSVIIHDIMEQLKTFTCNQ